MGWFSKKLKKVTKVLDPVGDKLRKSTGGSYGDPMNWYQSKPNQTTPYPQRTSPGLIAAPSGPAPPGMSFGGNTGGRSYIPNQFQNAGPMKPPGAPNVPTPSVPGGPAAAMSFGGPMQQAMIGAANQFQQQNQAPVMGNPQPMQQQMMRIGAIRGSNV